MSLLTVEHLSVVYEGRGESVRAVDDVSFTVEPGEVVALVGESGSGKSSVALALTRLLRTPPAVLSGRVVFDGVDLLRTPEDSLRTVRGGKIAYVFQDPATSLNPVLTVGEQLIEAMTLHTEARREDARRVAVDWLRRVGIPSAEERLEAYPHEFSGGMQQRACLAMALAARPSLLVADEPTTALDVTVQVQILRLLRDLQRSLALSVLLISHDLTVVERLAHRVGVMAKGGLVELGSVGQVLRQPAHPYTRELLRYRSMITLRRASGANG
jgi:ABC-type glutathione transport system ATPase component